MEETPTQEVVEEVSTNPEPEVEEQQAADAPTQDVPAEPQEETQEEPAAEAEEPAPQEPSRREQLRIQQLLDKYGEPKAKPEAPGIPDALDYNSALDADPTVIKQFEEDRKKYGEELYKRGLQQAESIQFHTRLEIDTPRVEAKYPQLNSESDQFDPRIADALNRQYLEYVGYRQQPDGSSVVERPGIRYADFIDAQFELANAIASEKVVKSSQNIAKQAAATGLRPDGSTAKRLDLTKAPEQMTDEELDAVLGTLPK